MPAARLCGQSAARPRQTAPCAATTCRCRWPRQAAPMDCAVRYASCWTHTQPFFPQKVDSLRRGLEGAFYLLFTRDDGVANDTRFFVAECAPCAYSLVRISFGGCAHSSIG